MDLKTAAYDTADSLNDDETMVEYQNADLEKQDDGIFAQALGAVARARGGIAEFAMRTRIFGEALDRALSGAGNPELGTVLKVIRLWRKVDRHALRWRDMIFTSATWRCVGKRFIQYA